MAAFQGPAIGNYGEFEPRRESFACLLRAAGLEKLDQHYDEFIREGLERLSRGERGEKVRAFAHDPSKLSIRTPAAQSECGLLVIDIGGSHTKTGYVRRMRGGSQEWRLLFDIPNDRLKGAIDGKPIYGFAAKVAEAVQVSLHEEGVRPSEIQGVGIIWSNAMDNLPLDPASGLSGITAYVTGIKEGKSYKKNEFFIKDLVDGFPVGSLFLQNLCAAGVKPASYVIGNDTVFVLKATAGASAGMVASTGANVTNVDKEGYIFNTEMGGLYVLNENLFGPADMLNGKNPTLESLMAGAWLPRVFGQHVAALAAAGVVELKKVAEGFSNGMSLKGEDLSDIMDNPLPPTYVPNVLLRDPEAKPFLRALVDALAARAGALAAGMAYFGLKTQLDQQEHVILSLDSSQARGLKPVYLETMQRRLDMLAGPGRVEIVLKEPTGPENKITVPMCGLAEAVAEFLPA